MAGRIVKKYQTDKGSIRRISLSTPIAALAGTEPAGVRDEDDYVAASGSSKKRTGVRARGYFYTRNRGTADAPSYQRVFVPFLTTTAFDAAPATITYNTFTFTQAGRKPEDAG